MQTLAICTWTVLSLTEIISSSLATSVLAGLRSPYSPRNKSSLDPIQSNNVIPPPGLTDSKPSAPESSVQGSSMVVLLNSKSKLNITPPSFRQFSMSTARNQISLLSSTSPSSSTSTSSLSSVPGLFSPTTWLSRASSTILWSLTSSTPFASTPLTSTPLTSTILITPEQTQSNSSPSAITEEERRQLLKSLQDSTTPKLIPTIVFLISIGIVGFFGNSLVLLVYSKKRRRNASDILIMAIAVLDLMMNTVAVPAEVYDMFHYWDFTIEQVCSFRLFFNAFITMSSALALVVVAGIRYKLVCRPYSRPVSVRCARRMSVGIPVLCSLVASPQILLYGIQSQRTHLPDVHGSACSIKDKYVYALWPKLYLGFLIVLFFLVTIPLIIIYVLIGIQAWRHSKINGIPIIAASAANSKCNNLSLTYETDEDVPRKDKQGVLPLSYRKEEEQNHIPPSEANPVMGEQKRREGGNCPQVQSSNDSWKKNVDTPGDTMLSTNDNDYNKKMLHSHTRVSCQVNVPMLNELTSRLNMIKEEMDKDPDRDGPNQDRQEIVEADTNQEHLESLSEFAASMQWVDSVYNRNNKNELEDESLDKASLSNVDTSSRKMSRQNSFSRKLTDTLTRARKAKKTGNQINFTYTVTTVDDEKKRSPNAITFDKDFLTPLPIATPQDGRKGSKTSPSSNQNHGPLKTNRGERRVLTRTTLMLIVISAVFVLAFLPHLTILFIKFNTYNFLERMNWSEYAAYNIFLRFYFLNSGANAIIYSLCDARFRKAAAKIIKCSK